ncbi:aromatic acid exporter family protein [Metabacillus litoralis]|uniref:aromatic acid exporter family protein n=1 Tax=Metabacillus TaxID=2675233 RepID=UPI000EF56E3E|nr:aromatic acid exporter family protein [Metabacillus litoralis]MCM3161648.1 aromatic acid exporter family protein [Metabacillus litoralis]MCM3412530.1 aromatic acid exporter family protein [Metabacillus litoralis]UHA57985.1 aromatic acid exporter family protein [Metabacillus litoralis]
MFKIGYRTAKTALGTTLAIMLAQFLGLDNYTSAGIITILCIQVTKKKSLKSSWARFLACLIAMIFSFVFFEGIAYHPLVIGLLLLFFIPTTVIVKATEGIVTSTVVIFHLFSEEQITLDIIGNELSIVVIGIGMALIMNLYMPSVEKKLKNLQIEIEENLAVIFQEIERYLTEKDQKWDGKEITKTAKLIDEAKTIAFRDVENHFLRHENSYYHYFKMREKQFEIIERVIPIVTSIHIAMEQSKMIADFLHELSLNIHPGNTANKFLSQLQEMKRSFEEMDLPKTREEFEARAALLHFVREMEQYLVIKSQFKGMEPNQRLHGMKAT